MPQPRVLPSSRFEKLARNEGKQAALWDPILAMVAVGIWASQIGRPAWWVLPLIFPAAMIGGGVLGWLGVPVPAG